MPALIDAVAPISYSPAGGELHRQLRGYKDHPAMVAREAFADGLADVLGRFLGEHEACVARAAGVEGAFGLLTTVPSRRPAGRVTGALVDLVGRRCSATAGRHDVVLQATGEGAPHRWCASRFRARASLAQCDVLLVDDTWTSGASAQGAALALKRAGARRVALVVIGRHLDDPAAARAVALGAVPPLDWAGCAWHVGQRC